MSLQQPTPVYGDWGAQDEGEGYSLQFQKKAMQRKKSSGPSPVLAPLEIASNATKGPVQAGVPAQPLIQSQPAVQAVAETRTGGKDSTQMPSFSFESGADVSYTAAFDSLREGKTKGSGGAGPSLPATSGKGPSSSQHSSDGTGQEAWAASAGTSKNEKPLVVQRAETPRKKVAWQ